MKEDAMDMKKVYRLNLIRDPKKRMESLKKILQKFLHLHRYSGIRMMKKNGEEVLELSFSRIGFRSQDLCFFKKEGTAWFELPEKDYEAISVWIRDSLSLDSPIYELMSPKTRRTEEMDWSEACQLLVAHRIWTSEHLRGIRESLKKTRSGINLR